MSYRLLVFLTFILFFSVGCQQETSEYHDDFIVFGTVINITLLGIDEKLARESFRHIREDLNSMHHTWHVWEPGPLMRTNALLQTKAVFTVEPGVLALIHVAKDLSIKSHDLFNPAIGELIALWGFHSHHQPEIPPSDKAIKTLLLHKPSMRDIDISANQMKSNNAAVKIDLGGVAKGYAIDRLFHYLKQHGIYNALINTGGDLKVIGKHGSRPWKVAIRDPRSGPNNKAQVTPAIVASLDVMDNEAIFTSGDYERYLKNKLNNDKHLHHIIDPRTGYPATGTQSVTVIHQNAATADAAATALFIAGPSQWVEIANAMGIKHVLLIDAAGNVHISRAMEARIKFEQARNIVERTEL